MTPTMTPRQVESFLRKIAPPDPRTGCTMWTAGHDQSGYGVLSVGSKAAGTARMASAHRLSYEHFVGPIPDGMFVCHSCDELWPGTEYRSCVNPDHLWLGTNADNMRDCAKKGRTSRLYGEHGGRSKLTESDVREIRRLRATGVLLRVLAERYGIGTAQASRLARGTSWTHLAENGVDPLAHRVRRV